MIPTVLGTRDIKIKGIVLSLKETTQFGFSASAQMKLYCVEQTRSSTW